MTEPSRVDAKQDIWAEREPGLPCQKHDVNLDDPIYFFDVKTPFWYMGAQFVGKKARKQFANLVFYKCRQCLRMIGTRPPPGVPRPIRVQSVFGDSDSDEE